MRWDDTTTIDAPAGRVWQLTLDVANWPAFLPTVQRVARLDDGPLRTGSSARVKQPAQTAAVWTVTRIEPGREFTWQTRRMGLTMVGSHRLEEVGSGCRNTLTIDVTGPGAGLFGALFGWAVRRSLSVENASFKTRAEEPA